MAVFYLKNCSFVTLFFFVFCICLEKETNASCGPSSVQFSHSVVSNSLQPQESQHARPPWTFLEGIVAKVSKLVFLWEPKKKDANINPKS